MIQSKYQRAWRENRKVQRTGVGEEKQKEEKDVNKTFLALQNTKAMRMKQVGSLGGGGGWSESSRTMATMRADG